jgi:cell shape-determining protein MreD
LLRLLLIVLLLGKLQKMLLVLLVLVQVLVLMLVLILMQVLQKWLLLLPSQKQPSSSSPVCLWAPAGPTPRPPRRCPRQIRRRTSR